MAESRPAALPPAERTVGQLVAESIRFYGDHFWAVVVLGVPFLVIDVLSLNASVTVQTLVAWAVGPALCAAYVRACMLVGRTFWSWRAYAVALIVYIPFPVLVRVYVLPGVVWFALIGLAVPAAVIEGIGVREAFRRGLELGRGGLHRLRSQPRRAARAPAHAGRPGPEDRGRHCRHHPLAAPLPRRPPALWGPGGAGRVGSRHADLHPALVALHPGRADAQVEPGSPARGQP